MDLLRILPQLTLEQLLFVAQRDGVPIQSKLSKEIVQADLLNAIEERQPGLITQFAQTLPSEYDIHDNNLQINLDSQSIHRELSREIEIQPSQSEIRGD